ncbi:hypothetical protein BTVI_31783 [Pitangus sulphuratus]|nr:hypothetical protein BTVI_31783 [Pitangus sulphuratus]
MLLLGLLLLTSALAGRRQGAVAESDLSSKFAFSGAKEQNGMFIPTNISVACEIIVDLKVSKPSPKGKVCDPDTG